MTAIAVPQQASAVARAAPGKRRAGAPGATLSWKWDPVKISLFVLTIIAVSRIHQHWKIIGRLRPALVMVALLAFYAIANPRSVKADNLVKYWPAKVVMAICALAYLSIPFGISMGNSGLFVLNVFSRTIVYALLVMVAVKSARDVYFHAWSYTIGAGILSWLSLFVFGLTKYDGYARLSDLYTYDANDTGLVVVMGLPLVLLVLQNAKPLGKVTAVLIAGAICATVARTGSRGAFVGLIAVALGMLFLVQSISVFKRVLVMTVGVVALTAWAPEGYWKQMHTVLAPDQDYNMRVREGRMEVAKRGMGYMLAYPVFGVGINNFQKAECSISEKAKTYVSGNPMRCTPPHNSYAQAGAELGVGGLLLFVTMIWGGAVSMVRLSRRLPKQWSHGTREQRLARMAPQYIAVSCVGFGTCSFFLSFAWMDVTYFLAALLVGAHAVADHHLAEWNAAARPSPMPQVRVPSAPPATREPIWARA